MTTPDRALCLLLRAHWRSPDRLCDDAVRGAGRRLGARRAGSVLRSLTIDRAVEDRILALDPMRIGDDDVRNALAKGPTPRIFGSTAASIRFIF